MRQGALGMLLTGGVIMAGSTWASGDVISVLVGDKDGFEGTHPIAGTEIPFNINAGFATLPGPGVYVDDAGMDAQNDSPFDGYGWTFVFDYDASGLQAIDQALVTIRHGSLGRRSNGEGYGYAEVWASQGGLRSVVGDFLSVPTVANQSEEQIRASVFDVTALVQSSPVGSLTVHVNGDVLVGTVDRFVIDYAELTLEGAVPEPGSVGVLGVLAGLLGRRRG